MQRFRAVILTAFLAGLIPGCGESQPNSPANPNEVEADFGAKTAAMMKNANSGMDPKAAARANKPGPVAGPRR